MWKNRDKIVGLGANTYSYQMLVVKIKKAKDPKKCAIKIKLKFENHKNSLKVTQLENKMNLLEKN